MKKTLLFLAAVLTFGLAATAQINTFPWVEDFESSALPADFTFVDADGDGNNWSISSGTRCHSGNNCVTSASWANSVILYPDNWMITPAIAIPADADDFRLSWWAVGQDPSYADENYSVYISTGNTVADFTATTAVFNGFPSNTGECTKEIVSLDNYRGQTIYVAFRHHNVSDMFRINIDDIRVGGPELPELSLTGTVEIAINQQATYTATTDATDIVWYVNDVAQTATGSTFTTTYSTKGNYTVKVEATNVAGTVNKSVTTRVYDPANAVARRTVLEHFTTAQCSQCPSGHTRIESAISGKEDRVIWIAHHVGYYTDDWTIAASQQLIDMYNDGGSTYAPASMLDRNNAYCDADDPGPVFFPGSDISTRVAKAIDAPAFVTCDFSNISYDASSRTLNATVGGYFTDDMSFDSPRLTLYIMEDGIMGSQAGYSGGQYEHNHVIRAAISDVWGDAAAITSTNAWDQYSKTFTYTLPAAWNADKCWIAAFVSNYSSDVNNRRIANGVKSRYLTDSHLGISDVEAGASVSVWPNPSTEIAYISAESTIRSYTMVNAMGQVVMAGENVNKEVVSIDVRNYAAGVYFVTITTDNGTATERLSVVK